MIEQYLAIDELHIGAHDSPERKFHDIAGHEVGGAYDTPDTIAVYRGDDGEARFEGIERRLRPPFLEQAKRRVEHKQTADNGGPHKLAEK